MSEVSKQQQETAEDEENAEFLTNCFFMLDDESLQGEEGNEDEVILYFSPQQVDQSKRLMVVGGFMAMKNFLSNFTQDTLRVVSLVHHTIAFEELDSGLMFTLSGPINEPISSLQKRLSRLVSWFHFLYGSYSIIRSQCSSRKELIETMTTIGNGLTESFLLPGGSLTNIGLPPIFLPIPFIDLPEELSRYFVSASQLLADIRADPLNLAGCILCGQSVLCTQLDLETTDSVLMLLNSENTYLPINSFSPPAKTTATNDSNSSINPNSQSTATPISTNNQLNTASTPTSAENIRRSSLDVGPKTFFNTIYLKKSAVKALRTPPSLPLPFANSSSSSSSASATCGTTNITNSSSISSSPGVVIGSHSPERVSFSSPFNVDNQDQQSTSSQSQQPQTSQEKPQEKDEMVKLGLFGLTIKSITLAVIMTTEALEDTKHAKKIHKLAHSDLLSIDSGLMQFFSHCRPSSEKLVSGNSDIQHSLPSSESDQRNIGNSVNQSSNIQLGLTNSLQQQQQQQQQQIENNQWALYDSLTGALKVNLNGMKLSPNNEQLLAFQSLTGIAHDALSQQQQGVNQVYLRRRNGTILSKKLFAKELHWFTSLQYSGHECFAEFVEHNRNISFKNSPDGQFF